MIHYDKNDKQNLKIKLNKTQNKIPKYTLDFFDFLI